MECSICRTEILEGKSIKLPCCLRNAHEKCQFQISCRKWNRMARNRNFGVEKCSVCNRKITTPFEKVFVSMTMAIKMVRKEITELDTITAKEVIGEAWKSELYKTFGDMLKDKYSLSMIRSSKLTMVETLGRFMESHTKGLLKSDYSASTRTSEDAPEVEVVGVDDLPDDVRENIEKTSPSK